MKETILYKITNSNMKEIYAKILKLIFSTNIYLISVYKNEGKY